MIIKEAWQVVRDPSALLVAFVLPPILLFFFSYGVNLDVKNVALGLVLEGDGPHAQDLAAAFAATPYLNVHPARHRAALEYRLINRQIQVIAVIPEDFDAQMNDPHRAAQIQVLTDGSEPNSANFMAGYVQGTFNNWLQGLPASGMSNERLLLESRYWFNPELESRRVIVPGAIAIVMTIIGTLLTAMVIAREWERGTMEALMSTPASNGEIILSKLLPYFVLGILAVSFCTLLATTLFGLPLRGGVGVLLLVSAAFLVAALGQGMLISTLSPNQFVAAQIALTTGFLPTLLLSGFVFDIGSMPDVVQWITTIVPGRYFVSSLQTVFLAGDLWDALLPDILALLALGLFLFTLTFFTTKRTLD
ncbi:MAG: ABC transporter permease [Pseudomonadota bacterium]